MKWQGRAGSGNIEDRRGMGMGLPIGGGIGGLVLLLLFSALTGQNPADLINDGGSDSVGTSGVQENDEQGQFVSVILRDTEETWSSVFQQRGATYQPPTLVLFTDATQSACGVGQSAMGPFYCPGDRKVYLDLGFFEELSRRFGAPGDFAQAYVLAHEIGHHVQTITGTEGQMRQMQRANPGSGNALSVRLELQADCYAGVWAARNKDRIEPGDIEEGLRAAHSIGDDTLMEAAGRRPVEAAFTHGTSAQRQQWLRKGLETGNEDACDTFADLQR